ncbi:LPXTG cell wall anchor domain-containing protein [Halobacillus salinarum]|uniref:LPXTG cell wall anchor domain-containing protein n=1 Tax=Halobacillus salinarum TaxID=2932257 RepID=A0ABY4EEF8_9BACI|nr:LPXTG cell wall anchor domain-containing protein [Halobacillus salinarum]UOQ42847.1 LPXTG cell wall anchor domain-containing protein [Halobacillus salinarum]
MFRKLSAVLIACVVFTTLHTSVFAENHGEPPVTDLEQKFKDLVKLEYGDHYQVKKYDSIERIEEEFKSIMVWPLADYYVDKIFYEKERKLYLRAIDGPFLHDIDRSKDYQLEKINDGHYKLTQEQDSGVTLTIDYSYEAGKWVFSNRMNIIGSNEGGELPDTATSLPLAMAIGGVLMAGGLVLLALSRRQTIKKC